MKQFVAIVLSSMLLTGCARSLGTPTPFNGEGALTEDEKHCLYSAALAASDSPLESETLKDVCRKIGIFDVHGNQNDNYMTFVSAHIQWSMKAETGPFKQQINTKEKAQAYIKKYLPPE